MLDDDASRTFVEELEEPEDTETKKTDKNISKRLGFNRFMIEDAMAVGRILLEKSDVRKMRNRLKRQIARNRRINAAMVEAERKGGDGQGLKEVEEVCPMPWSERMKRMYPKFY